MLSINSMYVSIGPNLSNVLPLINSFSGCDTTSSFYRKVKKSIWNKLKVYPQIIDNFNTFMEHPFRLFDQTSSLFDEIERFVILIYDKARSKARVNEASQEMFCRQNKALENLLPTQDALVQHIKRSTFEATIQAVSNSPSHIFSGRMGLPKNRWTADTIVDNHL